MNAFNTYDKSVDKMRVVKILIRVITPTYLKILFSAELRSPSIYAGIMA